MPAPLSYPRPTLPPPAVALTFRADAGLPLLANDEVHAVLRDVWLQSAWTHGWYVGQYVILPDEVRLLVQPAHAAHPLGTWNSAWKATSTFRINRSLCWDGAVWDAEHAADNLATPDDHSRAGEDLADLPARAGLARTRHDWRFGGMIWNLQFIPWPR
jgi:putative transposase